MQLDNNRTTQSPVLQGTEISRGDFLGCLVEGGIFGGLFGLCAVKLALDANRPMQKVAIADLVSNSERYFGRDIETSCRLQPAGSAKAELFFPLSPTMERFPSFSTVDRNYDLYRVDAKAEREFFVAFTSAEQSHKMFKSETPVVVRGRLERAFVEGKPVIVFEVASDFEGVAG